MKTKFIYPAILFLMMLGTSSCSILFTNDFAIDSKVLSMAETEVYNLKTRTGVVNPYDYRATAAYQAGQRIYMTMQTELQREGKESILANLRYEIVILDDAKVDCYSLGGGKIIIHAGLLDHLTSEDELAYIIAHELAHEIDKHSYKRLKSSFISDVGRNIIANVVSDEDTSRELYLSAFGVTASAFGGMKFSDKDETDADEKALMWVAKSLYNPKAAIAVISKLENLANAGFTVSFVKIHPTSPELYERIERLSEKYFQEYFLPSIQ